MCLATLLALRDQRIPLPAAAVAISPWTDLKCTGESYRTKNKVSAAPEGSWTVFSKYYVGENDPCLPLISPLYGVGPEDLRVRELGARSGTGGVTEVVVATNPTVEGDTTALYLKRLLEPTGVSVTRLATGIPVGGDLEYADRLTLARSFRGRTKL